MAEFVKQARDDPCADSRNRLFLIDGKQVYWDRAGKCADNSYAQRLFGATTQTILCETVDTLGGPHTFCANDEARKLFETIQNNRDLPDLGLGAGHKVEEVRFLPKAGTVIAFRTLFAFANFTIVPDQQNVVIKDEAEWAKVWTAHTSGPHQSFPLPKVDFARDMVIGVFAQTNPCDGMSVARVVAGEDKLVVETELRGPEANIMCAAVMVQKVHFIVVPRVDVQVEFVEVKATNMVNFSIDKSTRSMVFQPRQVVVKDQQSWDALWAEHAGKDAKPPAIDFNEWMVVGVFLGDRPGGCYSANIQSISHDEKQVNVRVLETVPGPLVLCTKDITAPAHLMATQRIDLPVVFSTEEVDVTMF